MTQEKKLERFIDSLGLRHFKGAELTPYWSREVGDGKNSCPHESLWPNIVQTLIVLDEIRERLGVPIHITSSYRDPDYNRAVGGEKASFHMKFMAIDFQADGKTPKECHAVARSLRNTTFRIDNHTFIWRGGIGKYPTFVHIDCRGYNADW